MKPGTLMCYGNKKQDSLLAKETQNISLFVVQSDQVLDNFLCLSIEPSSKDLNCTARNVLHPTGKMMNFVPGRMDRGCTWPRGGSNVEGEQPEKKMIKQI